MPSSLGLEKRNVAAPLPALDSRKLKDVTFNSKVQHFYYCINVQQLQKIHVAIYCPLAFSFNFFFLFYDFPHHNFHSLPQGKLNRVQEHVKIYSSEIYHHKDVLCEPYFIWKCSRMITYLYNWDSEKCSLHVTLKGVIYTFTVPTMRSWTFAKCKYPFPQFKHCACLILFHYLAGILS